MSLAQTSRFVVSDRFYVSCHSSKCASFSYMLSTSLLAQIIVPEVAMSAWCGAHTCARRGMAASGRGSQRRVLSDRFAEAMSLPMCPLLQFGTEDVFLQLGPVVVQHDILMLLAVVTDRSGSRRALDCLAADEVPGCRELVSLFVRFGSEL